MFTAQSTARPLSPWRPLAENVARAAAGRRVRVRGAERQIRRSDCPSVGSLGEAVRVVANAKCLLAAAAKSANNKPPRGSQSCCSFRRRPDPAPLLAAPISRTLADFKVQKVARGGSRRHESGAFGEQLPIPRPYLADAGAADVFIVAPLTLALGHSHAPTNAIWSARVGAPVRGC